MSYKVKDEIELALYIEDQEYPLGALNCLNFFHCAESTQYLVPTFHFAILDVTKSMTAMNLTDASRIRLVIKDTDFQQTMRFRHGTHFKPPSGGEELYDVDGFLDCPRFKDGTASLPINATSSGALSEVAGLCGLEYDGDATNDQQLWYPRNLSFSKFVNYIANHGYATDQSHMATAVTLDGTLRYKDVRAIKTFAPVTYGYSTSGVLQAMECTPITDSGMSNSLVGYRHSRVVQSVFKSGAFDELAVNPKSKDMMVNSQVRDAMKRGTISFSPISWGNEHEQYERARYQNSRFDALRNVGVTLLFPKPTNFKVLDGLQLTTNQHTHSAYDGEYVVSHKVIYVQGNTYAEKIIAYREGKS